MMAGMAKPGMGGGSKVGWGNAGFYPTQGNYNIYSGQMSS